MKNAIKLIAVFTLIVRLVHSQTIDAFAVGDTLTAATIEKVVGYDPKKAMILDFGTTTCSPCIKSLKLLDVLLPQFSEDLQVFFVTTEPRKTVDRFLVRSPIGKDLHIPIIAADSALHASFPHVAQPHSVWIDRHGVVKAITSHHYIREKTLQALVEGADFSEWLIKKEYPYDYQRNILELNKQNFNENPLPSRWYSSFISRQIPGVPSRGQKTYVDSVNKTVKVSALNLSIAEMYASLYKLAWGLYFFPNHIIMEVTEPHRYYYDLDYKDFLPEWNRKNTYCYEMTFPLALPEAERTKRIIQQLNWHFGIDVDLKTVKRECWVLRQNHSDHKSAQPTHKTGLERGITLYQLHTEINQLHDHVPFVSEFSELQDASDILMRITEAAYRDLALLNEQLTPYGLIVNVEKRELKTLFIKEVKVN